MDYSMKGEPMHPLAKIALPFLGLAIAPMGFSSGNNAFTQERDRNKIPDQYKWNLTEIYPTDDAWQKAQEELKTQIPSIEQFKGTLSQSPQQLFKCLDMLSNLNKTFSRLYSYASMISDQDTRVSKYQAMKQEMSQLGSTFSAAASFIEPEILKMNKATIDDFVKKEKGLEVYRHYLDDILRRQAHTGTAGEEKIIADASLMADAPDNIYGIFSNADFPYPEVTLSDGKTVKLDAAGFALYRAVPNRDDRKKVFDAFFGALNKYRGTFGSSLSAEVKKDMFYMKARKYNSCLESALDANNIPVQVYYSLVEGVNKNLPTFHRYLELRKRILGVDTLHYYDLYAPLVEGVDLKYSVDEAEKNILAALAPLGKDYVSVIQEAFRDRWIDMYPNDGKRSGAYSNGSVYDVHPYMLINYNGKYDDVSTVAHELGHTMQSYLSNKTQPYPTADYPIFVAEVASTFNEALLIDYMLKNIKDDKVRLSLLGNYLEGIKGTLFRQTQFAEFELRIHEMAEKGQALTGDALDKLYDEIVKKYYGSDQGICVVDDAVKAEWAYIPHFYYNFYVYQYATSFTASTALSEKVMAGDKAETKRYLEFLSAGGSDYPINLLKKAGVDMTTTQPFDLTMQKMNRIMDEMEKILDKTK
jgi:oligoendopeptidase F